MNSEQSEDIPDKIKTFDKIAPQDRHTSVIYDNYIIKHAGPDK